MVQMRLTEVTKSKNGTQPGCEASLGLRDDTVTGVIYPKSHSIVKPIDKHDLKSSRQVCLLCRDHKPAPRVQ